MTHNQHAADVGAKGCHVGHMGPDGSCLNCGWEMFPPKEPVSWWGEGFGEPCKLCGHEVLDLENHLASCAETRFAVDY